MELCNILNPPTSWEDVVALKLQCWKEKTMKAYLCCLVLDSVVYNIWRNRNAFQNDNHPKTKEQLLKQIMWEVCTRFLSKGKFKKTKGNEIGLSLIKKTED